MKKCVIAPDSFKGTLSAVEICEIVKEAVLRHFPACEVQLLPVADGGEGTVDCFLTALSGERISLNVTGPYGESLPGFYARFGDLAVVEMAAAAGLPLVEGRKNPALTTTFGVGELIRHAVKRGAKRVILGLGGSSTNDAGCGCAAALGARFLNESGEAFVPVGGTLDQVRKIDLSAVRKLLGGVELIAMCDVDNPLCGPTGAAHIFGPQKGADEQMVASLDEKMKIFAGIAAKTADEARIPGAGAAGGFGFGVVVLLGGVLKRGIDTVLDTVQFDRLIEGADLVVTGEGKLDTQSLRGKVVHGIATRAKRGKVPVLAIAGDIGEGIEAVYGLGVTAVLSTNRVAVPFEKARLRSRQDLAATADNAMRLIAWAQAAKS